MAYKVHTKAVHIISITKHARQNGIANIFPCSWVFFEYFMKINKSRKARTYHNILNYGTNGHFWLNQDWSFDFSCFLAFFFLNTPALWGGSRWFSFLMCVFRTLTVPETCVAIVAFIRISIVIIRLVNPTVSPQICRLEKKENKFKFGPFHLLHNLTFRPILTNFRFDLLLVINYRWLQKYAYQHRMLFVTSW